MLSDFKPQINVKDDNKILFFDLVTPPEPIFVPTTPEITTTATGK